MRDRRNDHRWLPVVLVQGEEFNVYERYVDDMLSPRGKERLNTLLQRDDVCELLKVSFPRCHD